MSTAARPLGANYRKLFASATADESPDLGARLAALGRSLGLHLVLATQRPAGIVSADMRANLALRIALRVRDAVDSLDIVESEQAAAELSRLTTEGVEVLEYVPVRGNFAEVFHQVMAEVAA